MIATSKDARLAALKRWNDMIHNSSNIFSSNNIQGSSPPSVFVGSHGYPNVLAGPLVPPEFGDTTILDSPESWTGRPISDIIRYRMNLIRGIKSIPARVTTSRYVQDLQDLAMGKNPTDTDMTFSGSIRGAGLADGHDAPYGPTGSIQESHISNITPDRTIQRLYYDTDLGTSEAVVQLYKEGASISRIQKCFSVGVFGIERRLVPTKWSITATDDIISKYMIQNIQEYPLVDSYRVHTFAHMGNSYCVILWPRRWAFGFSEAWYANGRILYGSDCEMGSGFRGPPNTAGAYYAARLAVAEYMHKNHFQGGAIVIREISPNYSIPVGVWQVREGVRASLQRHATICHSMDECWATSCSTMQIPKEGWLMQEGISRVVRQRTLSEYW
ncbi:MAG: hypothetical protein F4Y82_04705 [Cenarchaeum sp. SB0665_bin_23]|nr:hypothetical protein [Cenarchaeum sp. SB0665_bin_23]MYB46546.1 hypothetical protein [Cenarchaeum sp. SB0662_bin_33]MYD59105.1 hypothetical protein [Cenarchaeum sp. SB0678_bin_8]MYG33814.1 hypothetical protein [Cenarchaeum sp. SB0677_bin_16]MYJ27839.1 hypothetical protein [Cenarchaeum sp. SB0672_bin_9]